MGRVAACTLLSSGQPWLIQAGWLPSLVAPLACRLLLDHAIPPASAHCQCVLAVPAAAGSWPQPAAPLAHGSLCPQPLLCPGSSFAALPPSAPPSSVPPCLTLPHPQPGPQVRKVFQELFGSYPDYTLHTEQVLAREDANTVAVHFTASGEPSGGARERAGRDCSWEWGSTVAV